MKTGALLLTVFAVGMLPPTLMASVRGPARRLHPTPRGALGT